MEGKGRLGICLAMGMGVSLGITLAGALVIALAISGGWLPPEAGTTGAGILRGLAAFVGGAVTSGYYGRRKLPLCILTGGIYVAILLGIGRVGYGGIRVDWLTGCLPVAVGSVLGVIPSAMPKPGRLRIPGKMFR